MASKIAMLELSPRGAHRRYDLVQESHSMAGIVMIRVLMKLRAALGRREPLRAVWARDTSVGRWNAVTEPIVQKLSIASERLS
jgi:hypothetical protein